jgi:hypothetical protein
MREVCVPTPTTVDIPAGWLAQEPPLPDHCVRHGRPAARRVTFAVRSDPKIGSRKKVFQPGYTSLNRAEEYAQQVKIVKVSGWPLCESCVRRRTLGLAGTGVLFFGGLLAMIAGFIIGALDDGTNRALLIPILLGFAAMLLSPLPLRSASLPRITQTQVSADGAAVRVTDASAEFAQQMRSAGAA